MSGAPLLAALSAIAAVAATRELIADYGELVRTRLRRHARRLGRGGDPGGRFVGALDLAGRIRRAGLDGTVGIRAVLLAKAGATAGGAGVWAFSGPAMAPRPALGLLALCLLAGFLAPDLLLERIARDRSWRLRAELADGLDLIALETGAGVAVPRALASAAARGGGPLAEELGRAVAAIEAGARAGSILVELGRATAIGELSLAGRALERSHRIGVPLGDELRAQATALRQNRARAIGEAAERAGPKIQLVVALVLVPAVLLVIAAALLAHADSLLTGL